VGSSLCVQRRERYFSETPGQGPPCLAPRTPPMTSHRRADFHKLLTAIAISSSTSPFSVLPLLHVARWRNGRMSDLRSRGRGFDSRSGRYHVVSSWTGDCLWTGKPCRYITNTKVNPAFHFSGASKSSTGQSGLSG